LLFLLRCEVVLDVELHPNFLWSLALDHVCNCLAGQFQQILDVEIVCSLYRKWKAALSYPRKFSSKKETVTPETQNLA
jgi:hypothetical protein